MDALDSRSLRHVDCYTQKFAAPGQVRYHIVTAAGAWLPLGKEVFIIEVKGGRKGKNKGQQHNVSVRREGRGFVADPSHLEIVAGDMVLWHTADPAISGFTVSGEGTSGAFNSAALSLEAVYTHAFGLPGDYRWVDANGGPLSGIVQVRPLERTDKKSFETWVATLKNGALITINGEKAAPDKVEILVGQTVFWAIEKAPGISITDIRLMPGQRSNSGDPLHGEDAAT